MTTTATTTMMTTTTATMTESSAAIAETGSVQEAASGAAPRKYVDLELVRRAQEGDRAAFEAIYRRTVGNIAGYVGAIVRDRAATEDAVSETYLQAWRDLRSLRKPERFDAWLYRIAHRRALTEVRRARPHRPIEEAESVADERRSTEPQAALDGQLTAERVRGALLQLRESQREVLVLRHFGGLSHRAIAEELGKSEQAVRAAYSRAARELRRALEG